MPPTGFQADTVIEMLINESDQMSQHLEVTSARRRHVHDAQTLLRVLCHKKDKISSTFLRIQYHLPRSSGEIMVMICLWFIMFLTSKDLGNSTLQNLVCLRKICARKSHLQFTSSVVRFCRIEVPSSPVHRMTGIPLFCRLRWCSCEGCVI